MRAVPVVALLLLPALAAAGPVQSTKQASRRGPAKTAVRAKATGPQPPTACTAELDVRGVRWKRAKKPGIADAVQIMGPLGGMPYVSPEYDLIIDCSLAISLAEMAPYVAALGFDQVGFSSAYSRRNVRGTQRASKHSFGLAIDIHAFSGPELGSLRVAADYEQGLGDAVDCLGQPLTQGGAALKILQCQLTRSGLFRLVLSPDYDDAHHDHFHLEVKPWPERGALRAASPAIH